MNYSQRQHELNAQFQLGVNTHLEDSNIDIRFFPFKSLEFSNENKVFVNAVDEKINENLSFVYPVFIPGGMKQTDKAILLMHGLNERNWNKYLTWAEELCSKTGKPVILFPIAFHMNRSPFSWSNPRVLKSSIDLRKKKYGEDRTLSFANVTFSERISEKPYRFYSSGRQSLSDLTQLAIEIKQGKHPLFRENTQIDIFSYSIGAFLSQITLMTNPSGLFSDSKLFMFCGGSIFSFMFGESRFIMDKPAFARLLHYYISDFADEAIGKSTPDKGFESFYSMISPERNQAERVTFFNRLGDRLRGISLVKDKVIPYQGIVKAMGTACTESRIDLLDFSFPYMHENPFPIGERIESSNVDASFNHVFSTAAKFLA